MGGPGVGGRRRWEQRACRTGGGGVVRRTVAVPADGGASGSGSGALRWAGGYAHVDNQQHAHGALKKCRSISGSRTEKNYPCSDFKEFKHKRSGGNSTRCSVGEQMKNGIESYHSQPSVMSELMDFDAAMRVMISSQENSFSWPRENKIASSKNMVHSSYGSPYRPKFHLGKHSTNVKHCPPLKTYGSTSNCSYQWARGAGKYDSLNSANCSLSDKMSVLRQPRHGGNHLNQNCIAALRRRHNISYSRGTINLLRSSETPRQPVSSMGSHRQTLLDNALVRQNKFNCSEPLNEESIEQLWSSTNSESEKAVCFSSNGSIDDLQALSSETSDTSDNSSSSSLSITENDEWKMTFKKVHCPLGARLHSASLTNHKEIEQRSPVSVLELLAEDCSIAANVKLDLQLGHELVKFPSVKTVPEVGDIGEITDHILLGMDVSPNDEYIQLVDDILEEFGDEEERDFSYLLDILIVSGIHGTAEDLLYKVCQSVDCPAGYDVFEKLEKKYMKVAQWSRSDRKLIFDMVNTILSEILAPCFHMHPWVKTTRNTAPVWGSEGLLEKVMQILVQRREELGLSKAKPEKNALNQKWPDLTDCIDKVGRDVENMIRDDLLEELLLEMLSS